MNKIPLAMEELHRSEHELAVELLRMSDRHKAEHEVFHLARDLSQWSAEHIRELARAGRDRGLDLAEDVDEPSTLATGVREKTAELLGRRPEPGLVLLADLRRIHLMAAGVSLDWEVLGQAAQAARDRELLALTKRCHPETLRQARWANAMLKEAAPQVLLS